MAQPTHTTNTGGKHFFARIPKDTQKPEDCRNLYDDWAASYDADLTGPANDYVAPALVAQAVKAANGNIDGEVLDAGCGTGLSGVALAREGAKVIDGMDISPGMLKLAKKTGVYRDLTLVDLMKEIPEKADASYDVVTCVGTFTQGHVGPVPALREFVRVAKSGGVVIATVRSDLWASDGYEEEVERLKQEGLVEAVSTKEADYRRGAGVKARLLILKKR